MGFSGAWLDRSQVNPTVQLVPPLDPQHLKPDPNPQYTGRAQPDWVQGNAAPDLPAAMVDAVAQAPLHTGTGPVDHVNYDNPLAGIGYGHGLTDLEALDIARRANLTNDGSGAARAYEHARTPGGTYRAGFVWDNPEQQDSPDTVLLQRTGVGTPNDPYARQANRLERSFDGTIDMHRWDVHFRPLRPEYARPTPMQSTPGGDQTVPSTPSVIGYRPSPQDRFVQPVVRRAPGDWSQPWSADGTPSNLVGSVNAYGLTVWGM